MNSLSVRHGKKYTKYKKCLSMIKHYVKGVPIQSYSGPYFPAFGLNTERYSVSLCIQSECEKIRTRITPNSDTFYAVTVIGIKQHLSNI